MRVQVITLPKLKITKNISNADLYWQTVTWKIGATDFNFTHSYFAKIHPLRSNIILLNCVISCTCLFYSTLLLQHVEAHQPPGVRPQLNGWTHHSSFTLNFLTCVDFTCDDFTSSKILLQLDVRPLNLYYINILKSSGTSACVPVSWDVWRIGLSILLHLW